MSMVKVFCFSNAERSQCGFRTKSDLALVAWRVVQASGDRRIKTWLEEKDE